MHHTSAFFLAISNVANTDVPALTDQILAITNSHFLPPTDMNLLYLYVGSASLQRARLTSPSLRQITQPQIRPVSASLLPPTDPNVMVFDTFSPRVKALEELALQATTSQAMTENLYGVIGLQTQPQPIVNTDIYTLRATSTTAAVASAWSSIAYTLDDQLPAGLYALVGSEVQSTNAIAHRWTLDGQWQRPGGLSVTALGNRTVLQQYQGRWGEWGRFRNTSLPRLEVLANAADAAHVIYLQVQKVG